MKKDFDNIPAPDAEQSWQAAKKMLDQHFQSKRRKRRIAFVFLACLGLLCTSYLFHFQMNKPDRTGTVNIENKVIPNTINNDESELLNTEKPSDQLTGNKDDNASQIISRKDEIPNERAASQMNVIRSDRERKVQTTGISQENKAVVMMNNEPAMNSASKTGNKANDLSTVEIHTSNQTEIKSGIVQNSGTEVTSHAYKTEIPLNNELSFLSPVSKSEIENHIDIPNLLNKESVHPTTEPKRTAESGFALSFYMGIHQISKTLDAHEASEYLKRRENEEEVMYAPSVGINANWIENNFSAGIGIEYSYLGEKVAYGAYKPETKYEQYGNWQTYNRIVTDTDTAYISGLRWFLQTQVNQLDSIYTTYTDSSRIKVPDPTLSERNGTTKFYYVEVPIMIRYQFPFNRFSVGISAGVSPAWLSSENGYYLKEDQSAVESVSISKPLKTFILNGRVGINLSYSLNPRMNIFVNPQLKTNLKSISNTDNPIRQKYSAIGVNLGLVYRLY
jgi:hypothetical protein